MFLFCFSEESEEKSERRMKKRREWELLLGRESGYDLAFGSLEFFTEDLEEFVLEFVETRIRKMRRREGRLQRGVGGLASVGCFGGRVG